MHHVNRPWKLTTIWDGELPSSTNGWTPGWSTPVARTWEGTGISLRTFNRMIEVAPMSSRRRTRTPREKKKRKTHKSKKRKKKTQTYSHSSDENNSTQSDIDVEASDAQDDQDEPVFIAKGTYNHT
jgi:hypothetical protein